MPFLNLQALQLLLYLSILNLIRFAFPQGLQFQFPPVNDLIGSNFGLPGRNASSEYVILGGGTAGLAIAARLAQNGKSVIVIEAGGFYEVDNGNLSVIPADITFFAGASPQDTNPLVDWSFVTEPQTALNNRKFHYARGKCLGGSSARNYLTYHRSTSDAFSRWAQSVNDSTYTFEDLLPYLKRSANYTAATNDMRPQNATIPDASAEFDPDAGPLHVSYSPYANPGSSYISLGLERLGIGSIANFLGGSLIGRQSSAITVNPDQRTRSSAESSFLRSVLGNPLITIYKSTYAKKILFDDNKSATGVLVNTEGVQYSLMASKEVILSAGAFQSPQMLMVSGIGPKETLDSLSIPILSELPGVGQNMWDHVAFGPSYRIDLQSHARLSNPEFAGQAAQEYVQNQTGILTNTGNDILAWEKLPESNRQNLSADTRDKLNSFPADWPELEYLFLDAYAGKQLNYLQETPQTGFDYFSGVIAIISPSSRGNVSISSPDTADHPIINPNWLSDTADQEVAVAAFKRMRDIFATPEVKSILIGPEQYPGPDVDTDGQILEAIKESILTLYHASATCKMGTAQDPMAVVDSDHRVFGVRNLRVVDVSSFPFLVPGHPQSTVSGQHHQPLLCNCIPCGNTLDALAEKLAEKLINGS